MYVTKMEEGKCSRMKMESILSVVSGKPTEPGMTHDVSLTDWAMGCHTIHVVYYYASNPFVDGAMPSDLGNLRVTLSELLDEYPLVTGRLSRGAKGEWLVKFNDAGVRMLQADVDATLDEWMASADAAEERRDLTVWEEMPDDPSFWSPFRVQISKFKCGGIALGLSCTHMLADITSATMLMKSCALVHRHLTPTHPPIFHLPLPLYKPPPSLSLPPTATAPTKMATATFKFPASAVNKSLLHCPDATPFDVLTALFLSRLAKWHGKLSLSICLDCRNVESGQDQSIPYQYFGNALRFSTLAMDVDALGLDQLSAHIHRQVADMRKEGYSSEENGNDASRAYGSRLTFLNSEHMIEVESGRGLMYEAEFKKGESPVHVSYHVGNVGGEGLIMVMPSAEGGCGRTVTATLPEEQVAELCKDEIILDLKPMMILCGKRRG